MKLRHCDFCRSEMPDENNTVRVNYHSGEGFYVTLSVFSVPYEHKDVCQPCKRAIVKAMVHHEEAL